MGAIQVAEALGAARKAVRLYPPEHPTHRSAVRDLVSAVTGSIDVRPLVLNLREGHLYEGSDVLTDSSPAARALAEAMEVRRVESLTFHVGFSEADATGVSEAMSLKPTPELQVQAELDARGVRAVTVAELEDNLTRDAEDRDRRREADRSLYRAALSALNSVAAGIDAGEGQVSSAEVSRAVALLIERIEEDPHAMLALATMVGHGERWKSHSVSVMLHALVLGRHLGLSERALLELGRAALLHDVGVATQAAGGQSAGEHVQKSGGAYTLGALADENGVAMAVAHEHDIGVYAGGVLPDAESRRLHPYSRIVAVAHRYVSLTSPAEGQPMRPDHAAAQLVREASGGPLDPGYARLFVQVIGILPVGTVVRLADFSIGMVRAPGDDPLRPIVCLLLSPDGTTRRPPIDLNLAEDDRAIVEVIPKELLALEPSERL